LIFRRSEKIDCILLCKATLNICQNEATLDICQIEATLNICQNEATVNICQKKATLNIARFPNKNTSKTFSGGTCFLKNKNTQKTFLLFFCFQTKHLLLTISVCSKRFVLRCFLLLKAN